MKIASGQAELDGWLMDYAAKGTKIEPLGMERLTMEGSGLVDRHVGFGARRIKMSTNCARPARQSRHAVLDGLREQRPPSETRPPSKHRDWEFPRDQPGQKRCREP